MRNHNVVLILKPSILCINCLILVYVLSLIDHGVMGLWLKL